MESSEREREIFNTWFPTYTYDDRIRAKLQKVLKNFVASFCGTQAAKNTLSNTPFLLSYHVVTVAHTQTHTNAHTRTHTHFLSFTAPTPKIFSLQLTFFAWLLFLLLNTQTQLWY